MSTPRRPTPAVYRRRRLAVLAGLIVVLLLIGGGVWMLVAQPWANAAESTSPPGSTPSTSPAPSESTEGEASPTEGEGSESPEPTASTEPATPTAQPCTNASVLVEPVTDKEAYAAGEQPQLKLRLTNQSARDCTINVGTTQQIFTISSGSDVWWRSTDCQSEPSDMVVTLAAGQVVESVQAVPWDRTRSSVSTCEGDRDRAPGGGASYHLAVSIGGVEGHGTAQFLLY